MWALACLCAAPAAAQGARVYEDREAGIRLAAPPGARFTRLTDGDWRFTRGSFSFNVYFDFEVDPNKSGPEPAKAYVRANQGTFLSLLGARPVAYGTVPVAGGSAVSLAYQARHGRARAKGTYVFLATPGCMVTFAFQTTPRSYAVHQRLFSDALRSVQTFPSQPPDATLVPLKIRQLPDVNVRLPVPADWTYRQETATTHLFEGRQGSINVLQEALRRYVPSDAQIVVRTALEKSRPLRPKVEWEGALRVHGWPAYMARCRYGSGTTAFYVELLVVIQGEKLCRMEVLGPERYAPYLQKLTERIRGEWKLGSAGPAEAGPPGELKYAMEEVREAGLALELPEDWRPMDAFEGLSAFGGGLGSLVVAVPPVRRGGAPQTTEAALQELLGVIGGRIGGQAKVVARGTRTVQGFDEGDIAVFTAETGGEERAKGWIFLAPREDKVLLMVLVTQESAFPALRPVMERALKTVRPTIAAGTIVRSDGAGGSSAAGNSVPASQQVSREDRSASRSSGA